MTVGNLDRTIILGVEPVMTPCGTAVASAPG